MRDKIIDATVEEFKQNGLKFTMNDLAKRLGISKKTIYTVFESKQAVLVAVADRYAADLNSICNLQCSSFQSKQSKKRISSEYSIF